MRVLLVLILGLAHSAFAQQVETPSGKLVGSVSEHADAISVFAFHMPWLPLVRGAGHTPKRTQVGKACATPHASVRPVSSTLIQRARFSPTEPTSEDCLYLNVWSPGQRLNRCR